MGNETEGIRLHVFLARAGIASRRTAEEFILAGRVAVNGVIVSELGSKVFPDDIIFLDGKQVKKESRKLYIALNKPPGYICTSSDPQGRPLALSLLPKEISERLYSIGRLDFLSCGLILFTNDGDFAARIMHPSHELEKEYIVEATGHISDEVIEAFKQGITIEGVNYLARSVYRIGSRCIRIILIEGKNREIRRVFSHFHLHPAKLRRVRIGPVKLDKLAEGESRQLAKSEIKGLEANTKKTKERNYTW